MHSSLSMPPKLSHLHLATSLSEVQEQMHSGLLCRMWRCKECWQRKEEKRKERNLALVQRSSVDHLPPELTYEAVFHKICLNSSFFGSFVSLWAITTFLASMALSYQALLATGLSYVQTLRQGVFILSDKASSSISKHAWAQGAQGFLGVKYPLQCSTFSCYLLLLLAGSPLYRGVLLPSGVCRPQHSWTHSCRTKI